MDILSERAVRQPHRRWLSMVDGRSFTFSEAWYQILRFASALKTFGIGEGDTVGISLRNREEFVFLWFAAKYLGAAGVPLNPELKGRILSGMLGRSRPKIVFVEEDRRSSMDEALAQALVTDARTIALPQWGRMDEACSVETSEFHPFLDAAPIEVPPASPDPMQPVIISFTSGTTGPSKGILGTAPHVGATARINAEQQGFTDDDVVYTCLPLFHSNALISATCATIYAGCEVVISRRFSASRFWREVVDYNATTLSFLGSMIAVLLAREPEPIEREHRLRLVLAVPGTAAQIRELSARFGFQTVSAYGLSDMGIVLWTDTQGRAPAGSCGRPIDDFEVMLVDDLDAPVALGSVGELIIRPKTMWVAPGGYLNMPEETLKSWRNWWFHSGDLLKQDQAGWYYFVDRKKEAIRRRGENISTLELEDVVHSSKLVEECVAYAIKSDLGDDDVAIAVIWLGGKERVDDLLRYLVAELPSYAMPRYIRTVTEFERTGTEKVQRAGLVSDGVIDGMWDGGPLTGTVKGMDELVQRIT
nr:AMP-binding protein [Paracoccus sp. S-4012]